MNNIHKFIIINFMLLINFLFIIIYHPMTINLLILIQMINSAMILGMTMKSFWLSYIMFIIFISGLLIIFTYMCSISSNMMFKLNFKLLLIFTFISLNLMILMLILNHYFFYNFYKFNSFFFNWKLINMNSIMTYKIFSLNSMYISLTLIILLFFMLIITSVIMKFNNSPLRKKY
uniref:NADH dehydrogenase subunit 6 n=1 Tax=Abaria herringbona TaxID=2996732 RepID=A0A9E8RTP8_9NEOP|nr:NADH dehydrogenase subunit 6 [Abaria herringbona]UZZ43711.1 NADH dehydrogenase subunit 6 [Abaria herringbona]